MGTWGKLRKWFARLAPALLLGLLLPSATFAQSVNTYVNTDSGTVNSRTTCTRPLVRTFDVGSNYVIGKVELGVFATHTWRGDLRITLQSPNGTRVQLVDGDTNTTSGDNFNVLLSDDGTQLVNTDGATVNHSATSPPPFQHNFIPNAPLNAFSGQSSVGTWRLEICDQYTGADSGDFRYAALFLTSAPANYADLSISKAVSNANPLSGANISYTLTVANSAGSPSTASGVAVTDLLPPGASYTGHSGFGTYDPATGLWTVGALPPGQSRSLTINAVVTASAGATITNTAEVTASSVVDLDSAPANGAAGEDDHDNASFTVSGARTAGTPPMLICPKSTLLFDWDARAWSTGATSASYAMTGLGTIGFQISNPATWMNNFGGVSPIRTNTLTGGYSPSQYSLAQAIDFASNTQVASTTITLPLAVDGVQFRVFDVDYYGGQFADRIRVTGTFKGASVTPVLTNGAANFTIGNEAFGDALSADGSSDGNVVVTFQSAVDTIVIEYGNHTLAPANPGGQAITLHDITFCAPHAEIGVTKISSVVSDPVRGSTNPLAVPGALMSYCILMTNSGSAAATAVVGSDTLPTTMTYVAGSLRSGPSCGAASTIEDDDASGADETDPVGASIAGNQLTISVPSLGGFETLAVSFTATIN